MFVLISQRSSRWKSDGGNGGDSSDSFATYRQEQQTTQNYPQQIYSGDKSSSSSGDGGRASSEDKNASVQDSSASSGTRTEIAFSVLAAACSGVAPIHFPPNYSIPPPSVSPLNPPYNLPYVKNGSFSVLPPTPEPHESPSESLLPPVSEGEVTPVTTISSPSAERKDSTLLQSLLASRFTLVTTESEQTSSPDSSPIVTSSVLPPPCHVSSSSPSPSYTPEVHQQSYHSPSVGNNTTTTSAPPHSYLPQHHPSMFMYQAHPVNPFSPHSYIDPTMYGPPPSPHAYQHPPPTSQPMNFPPPQHTNHPPPPPHYISPQYPYPQAGYYPQPRMLHPNYVSSSMPPHSYPNLPMGVQGSLMRNNRGPVPQQMLEMREGGMDPALLQGKMPPHLIDFLIEHRMAALNNNNNNNMNNIAIPPDFRNNLFNGSGFNKYDNSDDCSSIASSRGDNHRRHKHSNHKKNVFPKDDEGSCHANNRQRVLRNMNSVCAITPPQSPLKQILKENLHDTTVDETASTVSQCSLSDDVNSVKSHHARHHHHGKHHRHHHHHHHKHHHRHHKHHHHHHQDKRNGNFRSYEAEVHSDNFNAADFDSIVPLEENKENFALQRQKKDINNNPERQTTNVETASIKVEGEDSLKDSKLTIVKPRVNGHKKAAEMNLAARRMVSTPQLVLARQRLSSMELPDVITPDTPNVPAQFPSLKIKLNH